MTDRYAGKPFLKLLDSYVLESIGHLDPADDAALTASDGPWRSVVAREMQFPQGMAGAIREMWDKGRVRFMESQGHEPDPGEFTRTFVDTKFPH